ncbi:Cathepsin L [Amphibalanus amphitrite]|uniref:Cathepsin L n=1 Tax=Amphibalanus amphitrite TaxID=1232801 RepID=A0A6A4WE16_AMPAM|nr:procathepsin L-like [Amphibalanus amphitrite]KAF0305907.1 Cathepsin L [Amphibalanus amphitrite]
MRVLLVLALAQAALGTWVDVDEWANFKRAHGKNYADQFVELKHMQTYAANKAYINKHNAEADAGLHTYRLGINKYADMTNEEFSALMTRRKPAGLHRQQQQHGRPFVGTGLTAPESIDWRDQGAVTPAKDQGQCGSCWSFSTTGSLEGMWKLAGNDLVSLSEQQLMDCSFSYGNNACNGGEMRYSFEYLTDIGGIMSEADYPYEARTHHNRCNYDPAKSVADCTDFVIIQTDDESKLLDAVGNVGPVAVGMDASHLDFQLYSSGIYSNANCGTAISELDHGVLAVGYGTDAEGDFWLVKNSWGAEWGMDGFFKMARNANNMCGIASDCVYPII